jgi:hypothetical protein
MPAAESSSAFRGSMLILPWLLIFPFFFVDVPPLLDYPNELARIFVLGLPNDPILSRFYEPDWRIIPNLAVDLIGPGLVGHLPIHLLGKLLLALALLLPVGGAIAYGRAVLGREWSPWLLGVTIVAFNGPFLLGLMNFQIGVGLALFGAAFWIEKRESAPLIAIAVSIVFALAVFFCNLFGVLFFGLLIGCHELARLMERRSGPAEAVRSAAVVALILAPAAILFGLSAVNGAPPDPAYPSWTAKLGGLLAPFAGYRLAVTWAAAVAVLGIAVLGWRRGRADRGSLLAMAVLVVAYAVSPSSIKGATFVDQRFVVMFALVLFSGFRPALPSGPAWVLPVVLQTLAMLKLADTGLAWAQHRADLARFRQVIASVPPGSRVLVVDAAPLQPLRLGEPASRMLPGLHRTTSNLPALLVIEQRAFWPSLVTAPAWQPVSLRPAFAGLAAPAGELPDASKLAPAADRPVGDSFLDGWPQRFDYVLVMNAGAAGDINAFRSGRLAFRAGSDLAALYVIRKAD